MIVVSDFNEEAKIDKKVAEILLLADDAELMFDYSQYRSLNWQPGSTKFAVFYDECEKFLQEKLSLVKDCRHGQELYVPLAISIDDLQSQAKEKLSDDVLIPSSESLCLQFFPSNQYVKTAFNPFETHWSVQH